jgi:hypothetical protein
MDLGDLVHDNLPAKRARRTQAAKREAELARVEDKWADLDITVSVLLRMRTGYSGCIKL